MTKEEKATSLMDELEKHCSATRHSLEVHKIVSEWQRFKDPDHKEAKAKKPTVESLKKDVEALKLQQDIDRNRDYPPTKINFCPYMKEHDEQRTPNP